MSRAVGYMLAYLVMFTVLCSVIYGAIIYANWETLGLFVDKCTRFDIMFPMLLSAGATTCGIIAMSILEGDW